VHQVGKDHLIHGSLLIVMDASATLSAASLRAAPRLPRDFFDRDARTVARELLGKLLVRREGRSLCAGRVVECEAYLGGKDPAAHAFNGRTERNAVLFGPPGHAYVYFIYGNHYCTNVSCTLSGNGGGVLLRALEPVFGVQAMAAARGIQLPPKPRTTQLRLISSGPGRLSEALGITRVRDNGKDFTSTRTDLWFAHDGYAVEQVHATPRIGITKAADRPLRFIIAGNPFVSGSRLL
jgi:DNA-3-methyladenine glycosylase